MSRIFTALVLLLVTGSAFADSAHISQMVHSEIAALSPPAGDLSIAYLSQIFGKVGGVLHGTTGQILGRMFDILNKGILVVATLWLAYTAGALSLRASQEGSFLGQNRNAAVVFVKIAVGFALIIPSPVTGYSPLQDIFMKIVVAGVGLADQVWDGALDYIRYGGALYIRPKNLQNDADIVKTALGTQTNAPTHYGYAVKILANEVCMLYHTGGENKVQFFPPSKGGVVDFPNTANFTSVTTGSTDTNKNIAGCGYAQNFYNAKAASSPKAFDNYPQAQKEQLSITSWSALRSLVTKLMPIARMIYYKEDETSSKYDIEPLIVAKSTFAALLNYSSTMASYQRLLAYTQATATSTTCTSDNTTMASSKGNWTCGNPSATTVKNLKHFGSGTSTKQSHSCSLLDGCTKTTTTTSYSNLGVVSRSKLHDDSFAEAESEGWMMAGRFFWDVEQTNNKAKALSLSNLFPTVVSIAATTANKFDDNVYGPVANAFFNLKTSSLAPQYPGKSVPVVIGDLWKEYINTQQSNLTQTTSEISSVTSFSTGNATVDTIGSLTGGDLNSAVQLLTNAKTEYNPIAVLMQTGRALINAAVSIWLGALFLTMGLAAVAGICDASSPGGLILKILSSWMKVILSTLCFILLIPGVILGYYVPLYPFAVYTFAAAGWLIMVIEGMAAAPLICVGLTHPEGHDFLGKAEQALMLFLSIFIRPALMVIGLIAAMLVSFVVFKMLLAGFTGLVSNFMTDQVGGFTSSSGGSYFLSLFSVAMILVVFGMLTMELIEQSYKLIYQLPNNIMRWIGGPQMGEEFGQMAKTAVKGAVGSVGQGAQQMGKGGMQAGGETGKEVGQFAKAKTSSVASDSEQSISGEADK